MIAKLHSPLTKQLRTNRGREVCFGEETQRSWHVLRPPQGQVIIGLALGFGRRSGYNGEAGKYVSHFWSISLPSTYPTLQKIGYCGTLLIPYSYE